MVTAVGAAAGRGEAAGRVGGRGGSGGDGNGDVVPPSRSSPTGSSLSGAASGGAGPTTVPPAMRPFMPSNSNRTPRPCAHTRGRGKRRSRVESPR
jgi:hypothetical protein